MTLVVNLFGGPGCGKSTTSAGLFHDMKKKSLNVELVTEYAKELVWSDSISAMSDQLYLLANQNRRLDRLVGKVDYVITDAPLLLSAYYGVKYGRHPEIVRRASHDIFND
jgi:tRNA uridine 5-carbamoylmethylation protein Kti12